MDHFAIPDACFYKLAIWQVNNLNFSDETGDKFYLFFSNFSFLTQKIIALQLDFCQNNV
jgi:hypothetical protein